MELPFELVEDILCKTPIKSLVRFKSACKQWYALFNDKRFIYKHLDHFQEQLLFIRMYTDKVQILNPETSEILSFPYASKGHTISSVIHCDGLLLCRFRDGPVSVNLAVWNPVFSRIKWIKPLHDPFEYSDTFGFGYDRNSYKILRYSLRSHKFEIYDFKSKVWRIFPATFDWSPLTPTLDVSMKGNMYCIARKKSNLEPFIQSFDFSKETFKPICSSLPFEVDFYYVIGGFSGFRQDRLSLLHQDILDITRKIEVWVTNKVTDEVVTWSKYFNVTHPNLPMVYTGYYARLDPTYFIHKTNSIMLWCDEFVEEDYVCPSFCEIGDGEVKKQVETGPRYRSGFDQDVSCGCAYVPSLVPVPE